MPSQNPQQQLSRSGRYYVTGLSNLFTTTLLRFPQSLKGVMVTKCDKPLELFSTCSTYSNSFYPLQLFLPFHMYSNLPVHKYPSFIFVEQPTNISPQSFSLPLSLSRFFSPRLPLFSATFSPTFDLFLYLYLSLSRPPSILVSFAFCSSTPSPLAFPLSSSLSLLPVSASLFSPSLSPPFLPLHLSISLSSLTFLSFSLPLSPSPALCL